ncbi:hypothetical protein RJ639_044557 [Escallonia herrerae]|uniref:Dof zinc finger protein n=1 Tax=Escallonia herrerae TaxID=1293975 RepID=A0AA88WE61_9ASTE|nr:hypothetical protein RJ639_044557 [Escallonia herrerae]
MALEAGERRAARTQVMGTRPAESELKQPCPRCESTNTKFCYYNNYNLSQPRHFCKACRRYWTLGGTLRNVPVGGATRKSSSKRPRTAAATASATSSSSSSTVTKDPASVGPAIIHEVGKVGLNDTVAGDGGLTFTEWLSTPRVSGFGPLSGFGHGLVSGLQGVGFGLNAWDWPTERASEGNGGDSGGSGGGSAYAGPSSGCNTSRSGGVDIEGGLAADGDCLAWPELAISTPGQGAVK